MEVFLNTSRVEKAIWKTIPRINSSANLHKFTPMVSTEKNYLGRGAVTLEKDKPTLDSHLVSEAERPRTNPQWVCMCPADLPDKELTVPGGAPPGWRTILSVFLRGCFPALLFLHINIERTCQQLHETVGQAWGHVFCLYTFQNLENGDGIMVQADTHSH